MGLAVASWACLTGVLAHELSGGLVLKGRWVLRLAVLLVASAETVKLRVLLALSPAHDYFFWVYAVYIGCQVGSCTGASGACRISARAPVSCAAALDVGLASLLGMSAAARPHGVMP